MPPALIEGVAGDGEAGTSDRARAQLGEIARERGHLGEVVSRLRFSARDGWDSDGELVDEDPVPASESPVYGRIGPVRPHYGFAGDHCLHEPCGRCGVTVWQLPPAR